MNTRSFLRYGFIMALPLLLLLVSCDRQSSRQYDNSMALAMGQATTEEAMPAESAAEPAAANEAIATAPDSIAASRFNAPEELHENTFRAVSHSPLSTFSIDVDAASYSNIRGHLDRGHTPPPSVVRIEELVNYFSYDYPEPTGEHPFAFNTEVADCPWNPAHKLVRVALQGKQVPAEQLPPANLVFLIDVSGSMSDPDKLPLLKEAFHKLIDQLRPQDRVAIVAYAGSAGLVLNSTPGSEKDAIREAIDQLESGGSTAGGEGITLAYKIATKYHRKDGNSRVILASDGDFNVGISTEKELVTLIEGKRNKGIFLSVLGFGIGNYRDRQMEQLADNGNGNYYYIDNLREGNRVLSTELSGTLYAIAKDVKLQIAFNPDQVSAYRLIGYENRTLTAQEFNDDKKDAGELGAGHSVTAFYEVVPVGVKMDYPIDQSNSEDYRLEGDQPIKFSSSDLMAARLRYKEPTGTTSRLIQHLITNNSKTIGSASTEFQFAASVVEWGLLLRGSQYRGAASYSNVLTRARRNVGYDPKGYRKEFLSLVQRSAELSGNDLASR